MTLTELYQLLRREISKSTNVTISTLGSRSFWDTNVLILHLKSTQNGFDNDVSVHTLSHIVPSR